MDNEQKPVKPTTAEEIQQAFRSCKHEHAAAYFNEAMEKLAVAFGAKPEETGLVPIADDDVTQAEVL